MESTEVNGNLPSLLEGELRIKWCSRQQLCKVRITNTSIVCTKPNGKDKRSKSSVEQSEQNTVVIGFQDIIGCRTVDGADQKVCLNVFACPVKKLTAKPLKLKVRSREILMIDFDGRENLEQNQQEALKWKETIDSQLMTMSPRTAGYGDKTDSRPILVLVNPCSGSGMAPAIFRDKIRPVFEQSGMNFKLIHTERVGHGKEIAKRVDLNEWYGILVVSGDGMMYEIINGLMERDDWEEAIKLPIGIIPGGSGNSISCSVLYTVRECYIGLTDHIIQACYVLAKHIVRPMDVTVIDTCTGDRLYASCSVNWGLICDVDIVSERWRWFGTSRFLMESVSKILALKRYKGKLSFLPVDGWDSSDFFKRNAKRGVKITGDDGRWRKTTEGVDIKREECKEKHHETTEMSNESNLDSKRNRNCNSVETGNGNCVNNVHGSGGRSDGADESGSGAPLGEIDELPKLTDPLPANWLTLEDEFITVTASMVSHLSDDFMSSPDSKLHDGMIYMYLIRSGASRLDIVNIVRDGETGKHLESERTEIIPVRAFRLEPITTKGYLAVDGEAVSYGPIQGRVIPGLARIIAM